jgi:hypothetical protein
MQSEINLLKPVFAQETDTLTPLEIELKKYILWGTVLVVTASVITIIVYLVVLTMHSAMVATNENLVRQLDAQKAKENTYAVIKSRISVVKNVLAVTKPMSRIVNTAVSVGKPPKLSNISQNDSGRIAVSYKSDGIVDAMQMTASLESYQSQSQIKTAQIDSFSDNETGTRISYSFLPVWGTP